MNAIEFVKKYDIETAISALHDMPKDWGAVYLRDCDFEFVKSPPSLGDWVCMGELHQIVEAWELVESYGGIKEAKRVYYDEFRSDINWSNLQKAINLVEQCQ